jgi:hypothetical protein
MSIGNASRGRRRGAGGAGRCSFQGGKEEDLGRPLVPVARIVGRLLAATHRLGDRTSLWTYLEEVDELLAGGETTSSHPE